MAQKNPRKSHISVNSSSAKANTRKKSSMNIFFLKNHKMNFLLLDKSKCDFQLKKITQYSKNGIFRVFMERKKENLSFCWSFTFLSVFPSVFTFFLSISFLLSTCYCHYFHFEGHSDSVCVYQVHFTQEAEKTNQKGKK